jgi:ribosomal protein L16 Arg81 hydroxylase
VASVDYQPPVFEGLARDALKEVEGQSRSVFIYNVERIDRYRDLLAEALDPMLDALAVDPRDVISREGYIFRAGGGGSATTSAHVDFECNFLLVTEGRKRVYIADVPDEQGELALEAMHSGLYGTCGEIPSPMTAFDLAPGEGVFLPPRAAHYVENGPDPCTALSVVFFHRNSQRQVPVYAINRRLRRVGLNPRPPGESRLRDAAKRLSHQAASTPTRMIRSVRDRRS